MLTAGVPGWGAGCHPNLSSMHLERELQGVTSCRSPRIAHIGRWKLWVQNSSCVSRTPHPGLLGKFVNQKMVTKGNKSRM